MKLLSNIMGPYHSKPNSIPSDIVIDEDYLKDIVEKLSFERVFETHANEVARTIVADEFNKIFGRVLVDVGPYHNVIVGDPRTAWILIGAHYDSVPGSPGADDNASAVAVMLAVAKALGRDVDKKYGACFVAFNSEEYGLAGSEAFVRGWQPKQLQQAHILEMVGYCKHEPNTQRNPLPFLPLSNVGDFVGIVGNNKSFLKHIIEQAGVSDVPAIGVSIPPLVSLSVAYKLSPDIFRSDHANFWEAKIPAVMWTDTSNFRNPNYHRAGDTPDTLDYKFMAQIAKILTHLVRIGKK